MHKWFSTNFAKHTSILVNRRERWLTVRCPLWQAICKGVCPWWSSILISVTYGNMDLKSSALPLAANQWTWEKSEILLQFNELLLLLCTSYFTYNTYKTDKRQIKDRYMVYFMQQLTDFTGKSQDVYFINNIILRTRMTVYDS